MELLNNIWNTLSTPNEGLMNIIMGLGSFMEAILSFLVFTALLNISSSHKQKIIYIFLSSIESWLVVTFIPSPFNTIANFIFAFFLIFILFKQTILKSFIAVLSPIIVFGLIGTLILNPYLTSLHISSEELTTVPIYRFFYLFIMYLLTFTITILLRKTNIKINILNDLDKKSQKIISINLIFGLITLIVQLTITVYYIDTLPLIITSLSFISLLAYFGISIYSLTRVTKLFVTTKKLESVEEYNKTLHILHDSVRGFKHDFDNIVTTIGGYIKTNDMDGLKKYYIQLEEDCQKVNNLYLLNPEIINNPRYI